MEVIILELGSEVLSWWLDKAVIFFNEQTLTNRTKKKCETEVIWSWGVRLVRPLAHWADLLNVEKRRIFNEPRKTKEKRNPPTQRVARRLLLRRTRKKSAYARYSGLRPDKKEKNGRQ
ncbi:MAG: hypothetical protein R6U84_10580 [Candidatus Cloacimonadales bacterium]